MNIPVTHHPAPAVGTSASRDAFRLAVPPEAHGTGAAWCPRAPHLHRHIQPRVRPTRSDRRPPL